MNIKEYFETNIELIIENAGKAGTISKKDDWFYEDEWDEE